MLEISPAIPDDTLLALFSDRAKLASQSVIANGKIPNAEAISAIPRPEPTSGSRRSRPDNRVRPQRRENRHGTRRVDG